LVRLLMERKRTKR